MAKTKSFKSQVLDFVQEQNRPLSWHEIHDFILDKKGLWPQMKDTYNTWEKRNFVKNDFRGYYAGYFSGPSYYAYKQGWNSHNSGALMRPSNRDNRYLAKNAEGKYILEIA